MNKPIPEKNHPYQKYPTIIKIGKIAEIKGLKIRSIMNKIALRMLFFGLTSFVTYFDFKISSF